MHPSGRFALSTGDDKSLRMWNLIKGRAAAGIKLPGPGTNVVWSISATRYAVSVGSQVLVFEVASGEVRAPRRVRQKLRCSWPHAFCRSAGVQHYPVGQAHQHHRFLDR